MSAAFTGTDRTDGTEELRVSMSPKSEYYTPTEKELAACRPCRLLLVTVFLLLLLGLLVASIVLIAITDKCNNRVSKMPVKSSIAYQVYVKSFKDSDDDGYGDINGLKSKLEYVKALGVNTLVLNDVVNNIDFGMDAKIGPMSEFKEFMEVAKRNHIVVLLQMNPVVTTSESQWFKDSISKVSAKKNWYMWSNINNTSNNWLTVDKKSAWHRLGVSNQTYYSYFGKTLPTLNYNNQEVVNMVKEKLKMWLDMGVKGFMLTSISRLTVDDKFRSNNITNVFDQDLDSSHELLQQFYKLVDSYGGVVWSIPKTSAKESVKYFGKVAKRESDLVVNDEIALMDSINAMKLNETISTYKSHLPMYGDMAWLVGGTDYKRLASRFTEEETKVISLFGLLLPNKVLPYYGDEALLKDTNGMSYSIMKWNKGVNAGFTKDISKAWIPLSSGGYQTINGFSKLSKLRVSQQEFSNSSVIIYAKKSTLIMVYGKKILVAVNFGNKDEVVGKLDGIKKGKILFSLKKDIDLNNLIIRSYELFVMEILK